MPISYRLRQFVYRAGQTSTLFALLQRKWYRLAAQQAAKSIARSPEVLAVHAIGSFARGTFEPGLSDIDLAVFIDDCSYERAQEIKAMIRRRHRRQRALFPMLEKHLPIYTRSETILYQDYLSPLLKGHWSKPLFSRHPEIADQLAVTVAGSRSTITQASENWKRALQIETGNYPTVFKAHLNRMLRSRRPLPKELPEGEKETIGFPPLHWEIPGSLYEPFRQLPGLQAIGIFPALDFLEDVPLEQMYGNLFNVVLKFEGELDAGHIAKLFKGFSPTAEASIYLAQHALYLPVFGPEHRRIKSETSAPLFFHLARAALRPMPAPGDSTCTFEATQASFLYERDLVARLRQINRGFVELVLNRRELFTVNHRHLAQIGAQLEMARDFGCTAEMFPHLKHWGRLEPASVKDFFELQARLNNQEVSNSLKVSVIVITKNRRDTCRSTLEAITRLSLPPDELIVVDNGSTDGTREMIQSFVAPFKVRYVFEPTPGIPDARNAGIRNATCDIIAFCDDDCTVDAQWLENLTMPFRYDSRIGCVGGKVAHENQESILNRFYANLFKNKEQETSL